MLQEGTEDTTGAWEIEATVEYSQTACEESMISALTDEIVNDRAAVWMEDEPMNKMSPIAESEASSHFGGRTRFGFPKIPGDLGSVAADSSSASLPGSDGDISPYSGNQLAVEPWSDGSSSPHSEKPLAV